MASAAATSSKNESESCVLCSNNYNRTRPSFCQCQHCSIPLCFDCMKEHHEELLQDVGQMSHQYNELQQLIQNKQMMIVDETAKSIEDVNRYFDTYIDQLRDTQKKIIANMEVVKQNAQDHVRQIDADLRLIGGEIQGLAKESVVQTVKMKKVSTKLKDIEQQLSTYQVMKTENGINIQPDISIKFECPPVEIEIAHSTNMETNETRQAELQEPPTKSSSFGMFGQLCVVQERPSKSSAFNFGQLPVVQEPPPKISSFNFGQLPVMQEPPSKSSLFNSFGPLSVMQKLPVNQIGNKNDKKDDSSECSNSDDDSSDASHVDTSDDVDRMASDGENILYTTYYEDESDRIAYCRMDDDDDDEDEYRCWNRSRIVDMIWWGSIEKFVCATKEGVHTVVYANKKFKITEVIHGKWSFIRVAANTSHLFLWIKSNKNDFRGIEVYSKQFESIRKIDFDNYRSKPFINESIGFCVTDKLIASIYTHMQNNNKVLEVTFCDMNMNKSNSITLGECNRNTEIRTNGEDRFFITTGQRSFHIVSSNARKETIELQYNGKWIAVLDDQNIAVSNGRSDIQLVPYSKYDLSTLFKSK